jgi:hypothetical protein
MDSPPSFLDASFKRYAEFENLGNGFIEALRYSQGIRPVNFKVHLSPHLWQEIVRAARTNQALQEALDRVKILYHLSKDNG